MFFPLAPLHRRRKSRQPPEMLSWSFLRMLLVVTVALPLAVLAACVLAFGAWAGYLKLLSRSDPLLRLPGADDGNPMQTMDDDVEEWARKHANARKDCASDNATPRNLHFPGLWPVRASPWSLLCGG